MIDWFLTALWRLRHPSARHCPQCKATWEGRKAMHRQGGLCHDCMAEQLEWEAESSRPWDAFEDIPPHVLMRELKTEIAPELRPKLDALLLKLTLDASDLEHERDEARAQLARSGA